MTKPPSVKEVSQAVRVALEKQVLAAEKVVADALRYAGCARPDQMAKFFLAAQANGGNADESQILKSLLGHVDVVQPSTASNRIKRTSWRKFTQYINEVLIREAQEDLRQRPPDDGRIHLPTDPHFEDYKPKRLKGDEALNVIAKAYYAVFNPKHNKRHPHAVPYLAIGVAWQYQGQWTFRPVHVQLLCENQVYDHLFHCRIILSVARRLEHPVGSILLDAWYDAGKVRNYLRCMGYTVLHRMRLGERGKTVIWIDKERRTLQDVAKEMLEDRSLRPYPVHRWGPNRKRTTFPVKQRILLGFLGATPPHERPRGEDGISRIQLQVALKNQDGNHVIDWNHTSAIAMHSPMDRFTCRFIYHVRWTIETLFQVLENSRPSHKEQLIGREVINFLTLVLLTTAMRDLRIALSILYPGHRAADRLLRDIAIRTWINGGLLLRYFR